MPLALALASVVSAVVALWPAAAGVVDPAAIRTMWVDNAPRPDHEACIQPLSVLVNEVHDRRTAHTDYQCRLRWRYFRVDVLTVSGAWHLRGVAVQGL